MLYSESWGLKCLLCWFITFSGVWSSCNLLFSGILGVWLFSCLLKAFSVVWSVLCVWINVYIWGTNVYNCCICICAQAYIEYGHYYFICELRSKRTTTYSKFVHCAFVCLLLAQLKARPVESQIRHVISMCKQSKT